jgi:hypothetical protein
MFRRILAQTFQFLLLIGAPSGCMLSLQLYDEPAAAVTQETGTTLPQGDVYLTASSTLTAGDCSAVLIEMKDSGGNFVPAPQSAVFSLAANSDAQIYTSNTCATTTTSLSWAQNQSFANVWIRKTSSGSSTLTLTDDGGFYTARTHNLGVDPGAVSQLVFLNQPVDSAAGSAL